MTTQNTNMKTFDKLEEMTSVETEALLDSAPLATVEKQREMHALAQLLVQRGNVVVPGCWNESGKDMTFILEQEYSTPPIFTEMWPFATLCINTHNALGIVDKDSGGIRFYDLDSESFVKFCSKRSLDELRVVALRNQHLYPSNDSVVVNMGPPGKY